MSETFFQVVITHPDGATSVAPVMGKRVNIGSSDSSHIQVKGTGILPKHARLLVNSHLRDSVLFVDLSTDPPLTYGWQVGGTMHIGAYTFKLERGVDQAVMDEAPGKTSEYPTPPPDLPGVRARTESKPVVDEDEFSPTESYPMPPMPPDLPGQRDDSYVPVSNPPPSMSGEAHRATVIGDALPVVSPDDEMIPWDEPPAIPAHEMNELPPVAQAAPDFDLPVDDEDSHTIDTQEMLPVEPEAVAAAPDVNVTDTYGSRSLPDDEEGWVTQPYTPVASMPSVSLPLLPDDEDEMLQYTQPKDWDYRSNLSAQVTINPVNVVPGERVRVPVSIRNSGQTSTEVRLMVAGLPGGWSYNATSHLVLQAGEVRAVDVIIQTQTGYTPPTLDVYVHVSDVQTPAIALQLPLRMVLKRDVDIAGRLEPSTVRDGDTAYLHLQNHTQAAARIFVSGQTASSDLYLLLGEHDFQLPPGQSVRVPVRFSVGRRPLLRESRHEFWLAAQQGHRAPLDYSGTVGVRPSLGVLPLLLFTAVVAVAVIALAAVLLNTVL